MKGIRLWARSAVCVCLALTVAAQWVGAAEPAKKKKGPGKLEFGGARHRLEKFEDKVRRARGEPFKLGYVEKASLDRIWKLKEKYPDDPDVEKLFQRARTALMRSKGQTSALPKDVLRYRENEKKLRDMFLKVADKDWAAYQKKIQDSGKLVPRAFPPPQHREVGLEEMADKYVIFDNFEYPTNEFTDMGRQFCFVGSRLRGYYYVELSNRAWLGAYEAVKRYRRFINRDVPEGMRWTLVGKVVGLELMVPQAGKKKTMSAHWGWLVVPVAIYVPGRTFATAEEKMEKGGSFAGEEKMEDIKSEMYTVRKVPKDVTPQRLTEIFVTAIKEKNHPLYLDCIDPNRRKTKTALQLCMYHWEWHQQRFATFYCHVTVPKAKIMVERGLDLSPGSFERKFLTAEQIAELKKRAGPTVWRGDLATQAFDVRGQQYGSPKPRYFRKTEDGRWYITNYPQPF